MTRERLQSLSETALQELARREGIYNFHELDHEELIDQILEAFEEDRSERELNNNSAIRLEKKKYDILRDEELNILSPEDIPFPDSYNETRIVALLRDPLWVYTYWDISPAEREKREENPLFAGYFLRVYEYNGGSTASDDTIGFFDIAVGREDRSWYINLNRTGSRYSVELRCSISGQEEVLATSNQVYSPKSYFAANQKEFLDEPETMMLMLSGLWDYDQTGRGTDEIPQRIISILDIHNIEL